MSRTIRQVNDRYMRSLAKSATGKALEVLIDTLLFSRFLELPLSAGLAIAVELICAMMSFLNERLWNLIDWNREVVGDSKVDEKCWRSMARATTGLAFQVAIDAVLLSAFAEAPLALGLAIATEVVCFVTSFVNDRLWNRVNWKREVVMKRRARC